jgi:hypothetical protein
VRGRVPGALRTENRSVCPNQGGQQYFLCGSNTSDKSRKENKIALRKMERKNI